MANYRDSQKINFSKAEESRFRQLFNDWAKSIEGYNRNRLGDQLKIVEVWDTPIYRGLLKTQYDNRTLENTYERIRGRSFPLRTITSASQIDRWASASYPTTFTNNENKFCIKGSQYIDGCHTCHATGKVTCSRCDGKGTILVSCKEKQVCTKCGGRGGDYVTHRKLEYYNTSEGVKSRYVDKQEFHSCSACSGKGYIEVPSFREETCPTCKGSGRVTCPTCVGDAHLVRYWELRQSLYYKVNVDYRFPSQVPLDEVPKIIKLFNNNTPWRVMEKLNIDKENFDKNDLASRPIVGSMLSRMPNKIEHLQHTAVCFNILEACECEAKTVVYEVDRKRYSCLLLGDDWELITVTSPVSDHMDDLKDKVNHYCSMRRFGKAWSVLQKVNKFPQAGSKEAYMQERLEERMALMSRLGGNLAIVLCALLIAPLLLTLYESGFYAPWTSWLMDKLDIGVLGMMLLSVVFVMYYSMRYCKRDLPGFAYRVASPLRRFIRGFVTGIGISIYLGALSVILTYVGITVLACKVVWIGITIVAFIIIIIAGLVQNIVT